MKSIGAYYDGSRSERVYNFVFIPTRDLVPLESIAMPCFLHCVAERAFGAVEIVSVGLCTAYALTSIQLILSFPSHEATALSGYMPFSLRTCVVPSLLQR